jgi:hypothetical protein
MSALDGTLRPVRLVDVFDFGMEVLPRAVRRLPLIALLLLPGGAFVNWYIQEKTAGYQEIVTELLNDVLERLLPPDPDTWTLEGPEAV